MVEAGQRMGEAAREPSDRPLRDVCERRLREENEAGNGAKPQARRAQDTPCTIKCSFAHWRTGRNDTTGF